MLQRNSCLFLGTTTHPYIQMWNLALTQPSQIYGSALWPTALPVSKETAPAQLPRMWCLHSGQGKAHSQRVVLMLP